MKTSLFKIFALSVGVAGGFAFAQQKTDLKPQPTKTNKALLVKDSLSAAEFRKKAAAQEKAQLSKPYHPEENAEEKIAALIKTAQQENKNIIIQAGGNWCIWCLRFNDFVQKTPDLKQIVDQHYLYYHLNFSPENKNEKVFTKYGNPGAKYGYPVFIVLDKNGKMIHTQDSSVLEEGKGYSREKVKDFFEKWKPES